MSNSLRHKKDFRCTALLLGGAMALFATLASLQPAKAFGISDIFGAIEDVVEIGEDGIGRAGSAIGKKAKKVGRGSITPTGPKRGRTETQRPARGSNAALPPPRGASERKNTSRLPPPRSSSQRPSTEGNGLPTCNSKFKNCSGGHHLGKGDRTKHYADRKRGRNVDNANRSSRSSKNRRNRRRGRNN